MCFRPAEISMEKNCPQCGAKNDFNNDVCDQCGATLPSAPKIPGGAPGAPASGTNSGNPLVDAIFRQKAEVCRERGVALSSDLVLTDRLPLSDAELSSLMSNLLNNAIEAAGKCPKPWIRMRIYPARDYLCMEVSNSADDASLRSNPALHTTKEQPDLHGIGLQVVREIAQRHQGMVFFDIDQPGQFTVRVLLHL